MPRWLVALLAVAALVIIAAGGLYLYTAADEKGITSDCIITSQGQKMCGETARAWCDVTDRLRASLRELPGDNSGINQAQRVCDQIRH